MQFIQDKETGKILEVLENEAQKSAYYFEVICDKDLKKMREARVEIDKRIDNLVEAEIKKYQNKALCAEKSLVYALNRKTKNNQVGLYHSLKQLQPVASFCYKADIAKLNVQYKIEGDSDESGKEV